jgi:hypothetical protein
MCRCFLVPISFWRFIQAEFTRDYMLECEEQKYLEKRERIYNFLLMPFSLEKVNETRLFHLKRQATKPIGFVSLDFSSSNENQVSRSQK